MRMNAGIILAGQGPDILGNMARGQQAAQAQNDASHTNAFRAMLQQNGPGIMQGQENALASLAQFDPQAALGVQSTRQTMDVQRQQLDMARAAAARAAAGWARDQDDATRERTAAELERALTGASFFYAQGDRAGYEGFLRQNGIDPTQFAFEAFPAHAASVSGALEALRGFMPPPAAPGFRAATAEELEQFGASAGQVGPDGRFYPVNPPGPNTVVNVGPDGTPGPQIGTIPQGFSAVPDPTAPSGYRMERIPGGPEDTTAATARRAGRATISGDIITEAADIALAAVDAGVGGATGWLLSNLPQTQAADLYRQVETLRAQASTTNIQAMREASPTGGALGAVSDRDISLLQNASGAIDPRSPTFERDLLMYTRQLLRTVHGADAGDAIFSQTYGDRAARLGLRVARPSSAAQPMAPQAGAPAAPRQSGPVTPEAIMQMSEEDLLQLDVLSLDAAGLAAMERRLGMGQ